MSYLEDYFRKEFNEKLVIKMPEREDEQLTAATQLLEKRREEEEVEAALAAQKEEFHMKMESLQQRKEELEKKKMTLKESLLKFDKFIKENDMKKARAEKKLSEEKELKKQKDQDIARLQEHHQTILCYKDRVVSKVARYAPYNTYMSNVIAAAPEEFGEVREVIDRYDTLTSTKQDLQAAEQRNQETLDRLKQELIFYNEEKNNAMLGCNNELAKLQSRLDDAQSSVIKWEAEWTHIRNTAAKKTLMLGTLKMSTHNLYQLVHRTQKSKRAEADIEDTDTQLLTIQQYLSDLNEIVKEIKKKDESECTNQDGY